ncbi:MAG: hypothetical protein AAGJ40_21235 [Planctomycetota bacterium]
MKSSLSDHVSRGVPNWLHIILIAALTFLAGCTPENTTSVIEQDEAAEQAMEDYEAAIAEADANRE